MNDSPRPDSLATVSQRIRAPHDMVYVNISVDDRGDIVEVIANSGNSGGMRRASLEAVYKLATTAINLGGEPREVAEALVDIRGPNVATDNGDPIYSDADAVAVAMLRYLDGAVSEPIKEDGEYVE